MNYCPTECRYFTPQNGVDLDQLASLESESTFQF